MQLTQVGAVTVEHQAHLHGPVHAQTTCHRPPCKPGGRQDHDRYCHTRRWGAHAAEHAPSQVEKELRSVSERRRQRSTARQSFQATYEQAVNTPDFAPVLQAGGCGLDIPKCPMHAQSCRNRTILVDSFCNISSPGGPRPIPLYDWHD